MLGSRQKVEGDVCGYGFGGWIQVRTTTPSAMKAVAVLRVGELILDVRAVCVSVAFCWGPDG